MERKIIVASHGRFASGIIDSLELICGKNKKVEPLDCYKTVNGVHFEPPEFQHCDIAVQYILFSY